MGSLDGKMALVTGSTSGIGRAIAVAFAAEGAELVVSGRDDERGHDTVDRIRGDGGTAAFISADLGSSPAAARAFATRAVEALNGRVDILVNNAGIFPGFLPALSTVELDDRTLDEIWAVNVRAAYLLTASLAPAMAQRGSGVIINLGSTAAHVGLAVGAMYAATKAAVEQLSRSWAAEYGPAGVRVNNIAPGFVLTEGLSVARELVDPFVARLPAGRYGTPEEIANAAVYLANDGGAFIQGSTLMIDGGALATR